MNQDGQNHVSLESDEPVGDSQLSDRRADVLLRNEHVGSPTPTDIDADGCVCGVLRPAIVHLDMETEKTTPSSSAD